MSEVHFARLVDLLGPAFVRKSVWRFLPPAIPSIIYFLKLGAVLHMSQMRIFSAEGHKKEDCCNRQLTMFRKCRATLELCNRESIASIHMTCSGWLEKNFVRLAATKGLATMMSESSGEVVSGTNKHILF